MQYETGGRGVRGGEIDRIEGFSRLRFLAVQEMEGPQGDFWVSMLEASTIYGILGRIAAYDPDGVIPFRVYDQEQKEFVEPVQIAIGMLHIERSEKWKRRTEPKVDWLKEGF